MNRGEIPSQTAALLAAGAYKPDRAQEIYEKTGWLMSVDDDTKDQNYVRYSRRMPDGTTHYVVAYSGTRIFEPRHVLSDLWADVRVAVGLGQNHSGRFKEAIGAAQQAVADAGGRADRVSLVGHSLGASEAIAAGNAVNVRSVDAFSPPVMAAMDGPRRFYNLVRGLPEKKNVRLHVTKLDPVSWGSLFEHPYTTIVHGQKRANPHALENFL